MLLLPVRDARLGARGGGDVEDAHRFFPPVSPAARARWSRLETVSLLVRRLAKLEVTERGLV